MYAFSRLRFHRAELLWLSGEKDTSRHMLNSLKKKLTALQGEIGGSDSPLNGLLSEVLLTLGQWSVELKSHGASDILKQYFGPCLTILESERNPSPRGVKGSRVRLEAFLTVARFCDEQYQRLREHMESAEYAEGLRIREKLSRDADQM